MRVKRTKDHPKLKTKDFAKHICPIGVVDPKYFYVWSYWSPKLHKTIHKHTPDKYLKKCYCGIPYLSRLHAKHVWYSLYGKKALKYIHVIQGRNLIKLGITSFPNITLKRVCIGDKLRIGKRFIPFPEKYIHSRNSLTSTRYKLLGYWNRHHQNKKLFNAYYRRCYFGYCKGISGKRSTSIIKELLENQELFEND